MTIRALVLFSLACVGCTNDGLTVRNNEPSATVVYPLAETELVEGYPTTFLGSVTDTNDHPEDLVATWLLGDEVLCEEAPITADGATVCESTFEQGDIEVTLATRDPDDALGASTIALRVLPNQAPVVEIVTPDGAGPYQAEAYIVFEAIVSDAEVDPSALVVAWHDASGAAVDIDDRVDTDGTLSGAIRLAAGTHVITLTATDGQGQVGSASVTLEVTDP